MAAAIALSLALVALHKAVTSAELHDQQVVREDLEVQAHNLLWEETDQNELLLLKTLPSVTAKQITHQYQVVTSYGSRKGFGFFSEKSLPGATNFKTERRGINIRLIGERGPTYLLAQMEEVVDALGASDPAGIERVALRRNLLEKKQRAMLLSDTRTTRLGTGSLRFKGLLQLIDEGTDGTTGKASPYGSHIIDLEGQPFTVATLREYSARGINFFGMFTGLVMDAFVRADLEASMDSAQRLPLPLGTRAYMLGQQIGGFQTQGGYIPFMTDRAFAPEFLWGRYTDDTDELEEGYPPGTPLVSASAAPGAGSKWDAASAGNVFYVVTQKKDEKEGLGTRYPAGLAFLAVAAGDNVTLTVTPSDPLVDSYLVYRGHEDTGSAATDAFFIFEYAGNGTGAAVSIVDKNEWRPNHGLVLGTRIVSAAYEAIHAGSPEAYYNARSRSSDFLTMPDGPRNTLAVAHLGPQMGVMELARILPTVDNPLLFTAFAPLVRNPYQNVVFKNVGRA